MAASSPNPSPSPSATWSRRILWCAPGRRRPRRCRANPETTGFRASAATIPSPARSATTRSLAEPATTRSLAATGRTSSCSIRSPRLRTATPSRISLPVDDVVHLSRKVFSKLSKGALSSKAFLIGDHFKDKDDRVLYLKKAGALFYDPDGSGSAKAIQFASIGKNLKITHKDFFVI